MLVNPLCAFAASSTLPKNVLSHASHPVSVHTALKTHDAFLLWFFFLRCYFKSPLARNASYRTTIYNCTQTQIHTQRINSLEPPALPPQTLREKINFFFACCGHLFCATVDRKRRRPAPWQCCQLGGHLIAVPDTGQTTLSAAQYRVCDFAFTTRHTMSSRFVSVCLN